MRASGGRTCKTKAARPSRQRPATPGGGTRGKGKDMGGGGLGSKGSDGKFSRDLAGVQICWSWARKAGGCSDPCPAKRAHVCEICRGPHRSVDHKG